MESQDNLKAEQMTEEKIASMKEIFSIFDKDNDNAIITRDVAPLLRSLGFNPSEKEVKELVDKYDPKGDGMLEFPTLLEMVGKMTHEGDSQDEVEEAFRVFDQSGTGVLSAAEFRQIITSLGEKLSEEDADELIAFADSSGKGEINYRELIQSLLKEG